MCVTFTTGAEEVVAAALLLALATLKGSKAGMGMALSVALEFVCAEEFAAVDVPVGLMLEEDFLADNALLDDARFPIMTINLSGEGGKASQRSRGREVEIRKKNAGC